MPNKPEMIVITNKYIDPKDECQYDNPMSFCSLCGCWMNCKRDGIDAEYRRRPNVEVDTGGDMAGQESQMPEPKSLVEHVLGLLRIK